MSSWLWRIEVERIILDTSRGMPRVIPLERIGRITLETGHHKFQESEVVYALIADSSMYRAGIGVRSESPLMQLLKRQPDGHFRLIFWKQLPSSWLRGDKRHLGFYGYAIVKKVRDEIVFDTKYFQVGMLNPYNLQTWNPIEQIRRSNESKNPLVFDMPWGDKLTS